MFPFLDIIPIPESGHRIVKPIKVDPVEIIDSTEKPANQVVDTITNSADTLAQGASSLQGIADNAAGASSSMLVWSIVVVLIALAICISLAWRYRRHRLA